MFLKVYRPAALPEREGSLAFASECCSSEEDVVQDPGRQRLRHAHHHLAVGGPREEEGGCYLG